MLGTWSRPPLRSLSVCPSVLVGGLFLGLRVCSALLSVLFCAPPVWVLLSFRLLLAAALALSAVCGGSVVAFLGRSCTGPFPPLSWGGRCYSRLPHRSAASSCWPRLGVFPPPLLCLFLFCIDLRALPGLICPDGFFFCPLSFSSRRARCSGRSFRVCVCVCVVGLLLFGPGLLFPCRGPGPRRRTSFVLLALVGAFFHAIVFFFLL